MGPEETAWLLQYSKSSGANHHAIPTFQKRQNVRTYADSLFVVNMDHFYTHGSRYKLAAVHTSRSPAASSPGRRPRRYHSVTGHIAWHCRCEPHPLRLYPRSLTGYKVQPAGIAKSLTTAQGRISVHYFCRLAGRPTVLVGY